MFGNTHLKMSETKHHLTRFSLKEIPRGAEDQRHQQMIHLPGSFFFFSEARCKL